MAKDKKNGFNKEKDKETGAECGSSGTQEKAAAAEDKPAAEEEAGGEDAPDEFSELKEKMASLQDKYLRQAAEFDNYKKRIRKEKSELILNGGEKVITSLLPVLDDFERALANIRKEDEENALLQGIELIYQKLATTLQTHGLDIIKTENADFDTDYHEAIAMISVEDKEMKGKVVDCVQKGYTLNNKVIRHSKVAVGQ